MLVVIFEETYSFQIGFHESLVVDRLLFGSVNYERVVLNLNYESFNKYIKSIDFFVLNEYKKKERERIFYPKFHRSY